MKEKKFKKMSLDPIYLEASARTPVSAIVLVMLELHGQQAYDLLKKYDFNFDDMPGVDEKYGQATKGDL